MATTQTDEVRSKMFDVVEQEVFPGDEKVINR
jgi:hypothetical protein